MSDTITTQVMLKRIGLKASPEPSAELVLTTSDLNAAVDLSWFIGQQVRLDLTPWQARLPDPEPEHDDDADEAEDEPAAATSANGAGRRRRTPASAGF
jgi:hypothetical protein